MVNLEWPINLGISTIIIFSSKYYVKFSIIKLAVTPHHNRIRIYILN
jgi:hypothetical protein